MSNPQEMKYDDNEQYERMAYGYHYLLHALKDALCELAEDKGPEHLDRFLAKRKRRSGEALRQGYATANLPAANPGIRYGEDALATAVSHARRATATPYLPEDG